MGSAQGLDPASGGAGPISSHPAVARLFAERPRPRRIRDWRHAHWLAVASVCLGAFMGQLDASITTLTFPALQRGFGVPLAAVEWVSLSYLLVLVALLTPVGRLSDLLGRKAMYLWGFVVFTAASLLCGLAGQLWLLIAFRALQAVGAALMQANSVALVSTAMPRDRIRSGLGVQAAAQAIGLALGPTLGGLLVEGAGWRWVFWVNVPVGAVALVAGYYLLPRTRTADGRIGGVRAPAAGAGRRFDLGGLALLAAATTSALLALSAASGLDLPGWAVALLLVLAAGFGGVLVRRERRVESPLIDPRMLTAKGVRGGLLAGVFGYLLLFCPLVLVPELLGAKGVGASASGLLLTALPAAFAVSATAGGALVPRGWGDRARAAAGSLVSACGLGGLIAATALGAPDAALVPGLAAVGWGLGLLLPANNALVMRAIPSEQAGAAGGLVNMTRGLGTSLGVALPALGVHLAGVAGGSVWVLGVLAAAAVGVCAGTARGPR
ncbi:MFS transporter [Phaeacidiphilus oryzae]|uniref:MFS transporter n=1 Tax=Phaeacidiphilus oryzae TaxID=348818 RepID=UPI0009FF3CB9|nr:MFS transporter [Phaeacidiphilus oryzae]